VFPKTSLLKNILTCDLLKLSDEFQNKYMSSSIPIILYVMAVAVRIFPCW